MNIKIDKDDFDFLNRHKISEVTFGSHLYGTNTPESDRDILIIYYHEFGVADCYPNHHLLQYDSVEDNTQYLFATPTQVTRNMFSGDSTIFADITMFSATQTLPKEEILNLVRTYNIIKAYIGFAKRDIKQIKKGKNKKFHILRGLYTAECLLDNKLPELDIIRHIFEHNSIVDDFVVEDAIALEFELRKRCNEMFENDELTMFPKNNIAKVESSLEQKIIDAQNIKMFKYD